MYSFDVYVDKFQIYYMTYLRLNIHKTIKIFITEISYSKFFTKFRWDDGWLNVLLFAKAGVYNYRCSSNTMQNDCSS